MSKISSDAPSLRESPKVRAKPYRSDWRYGIVNRVGDVWSPETFDNPEGAAEYLASASRYYPKWDLSRHRVVPVKVTVSVSNRKDGSSQKDTPQ